MSDQLSCALAQLAHIITLQQLCKYARCALTSPTLAEPGVHPAIASEPNVYASWCMLQARSAWASRRCSSTCGVARHGSTQQCLSAHQTAAAAAAPCWVTQSATSGHRLQTATCTQLQRRWGEEERNCAAVALRIQRLHAVLAVVRGILRSNVVHAGTHFLPQLPLTLSSQQQQQQDSSLARQPHHDCAKEPTCYLLFALCRWLPAAQRCRLLQTLQPATQPSACQPARMGQRQWAGRQPGSLLLSWTRTTMQ